MLAVHAATGTEMMTELIDVVGTELASVADKGPTPAELARAKAQLKAGLMMALESSSARAEQMARQLLNFGRLIEAPELIAKVDAVTVADVRDFASLVGSSRPSVAVVGAGKKSRELGAHAERATARSGAGAGTWHSRGPASSLTARRSSMAGACG
jgi:predicted Zn-dependent peptidase